MGTGEWEEKCDENTLYLYTKFSKNNEKRIHKDIQIFKWDKAVSNTITDVKSSTKQLKLYLEKKSTTWCLESF